ncbi:hypothetical protein [Rhodococcus opacus]|uniref:hypothetical protein n=1 Tax=Rhodococcus opacus TaxID=37919 RepID=UPI0024754811|nr:hypothetical protein [Rhodococcus opacus]MDH6291239.1 hypothetical protein [Rhodococcus opacus]
MPQPTQVTRPALNQRTHSAVSRSVSARLLDDEHTGDQGVAFVVITRPLQDSAGEYVDAERGKRRCRQNVRALGGDPWSVAVVYAICSLPCEQEPPKLLADWIRGPRHIENKLHRVRDVTFDWGHLPLAGADRSTVRTGHGPRAMATSRNVTGSLYRRAGHSNIARACRRLSANPHHAADMVLRA